MHQAPSVILREMGPVWRLVLSNPAHRNAMTLDMWRSLPHLVRRCEESDGVRVVIVEGAGEDFCAGADISEFAQLRSDPDQVRAYDEAVSLAQESLAAATRPTIALVRGTCFGGGIGIALACDLRLARSDARFRIPAGRLGLGYGLGSVGALVREIGMQAAADVLFSAETFGAERAVEDGLVRRSFEPAAFDAATNGIIDTMTANAPLTLRAVKLALQELKKPAAERDHARVANAVADCFASCDYLEGRQAFAEGRDAVFKGR